MASHLIDTNVIIDASAPRAPWHAWSTAALRYALEADAAAINPIIFSELAKNYTQAQHLEHAFPPDVYARLDLPWESCFPAGQAHLRYRQAGGLRDRTLPDFLIGAHAQVAGLILVTRDATRYRSYFPDLQIIEPGTHFRDLVPKTPSAMAASNPRK